MIRRCEEADFEAILAVGNEAARAYDGVIPADRYHEPYMPAEELRGEIEAGVEFWAWEEGGAVLGVMGIQDVKDVKDVKDVALIRHAYVRSADQGRGIGGRLLERLRDQTARPLLVGTWADAFWAVRFYEKHGFAPPPKRRLRCCAATGRSRSARSRHRWCLPNAGPRVSR